MVTGRKAVSMSAIERGSTERHPGGVGRERVQRIDGPVPQIVTAKERQARKARRKNARTARKRGRK